MAEVQRTAQSGELTQQFIQLVSLLAQQASASLGLLEDPRGGEPPANLDYARLFIDQLSMLQEKTRGNLSTEEAGILRNAISNLQLAYVEISGGRGPQPAASHLTVDVAPAAATIVDEPATPRPSTPAVEAASPLSSATPPSAVEVATEERESKKRFTKSYGS